MLSLEPQKIRIWLDLWNWVSERWQEPPDEIINAIKTKYSHPGSSKQGATGQTQTWSDEGLKPADLDSVMAAEAFAKEIKCQRCGKFDHTLRVVAFPYVISFLIAATRKVGESGIFCHSCRCKKSIKWAIVSLLFGWWSIPGFFWTIGVLIDNFRSGKMPRENNVPFVARLAWAHMVLGKIAEAKTALKELLKHGPNEEAQQLQRELDIRYPEVSPAKTSEFRLGYLTVVFAILGVYAIVGINMFGGTSTTPTAPSQVAPSFTSPSQPAPPVTPAPSLPSPITRDLSSYLKIYLDANYTIPWDSNNIPDLNNLTWSASDNNGWQSSYLVVYARNVGDEAIKVHVTSYQDLQHVPLTGYGASSDELLLKPNERKPLTIKISQSPSVRSFASTSSPNVVIYFQISTAN